MSTAPMMLSTPPAAPVAKAPAAAPDKTGSDGSFSEVLNEQTAKADGKDLPSDGESSPVEESEHEIVHEVVQEEPSADQTLAGLNAIVAALPEVPVAAAEPEGLELGLYSIPVEQLETEIIPIAASDQTPIPFNPLTLAIQQGLGGEKSNPDPLSQERGLQTHISSQRGMGREPGALNAITLANGDALEDGLQQELRQGLGGFNKEALPAGMKVQTEAGAVDFQQLMGRIGAERPPAMPQVAPLAGMARPLEIPVGQNGWDQGVGERLQWMIGQGMQRAELKLHPQHLGPVDIRLSIQNDQTNVTFLAHHAVTREALEASLPRLREMMADSNINLGSVDVGRREAESQQRQAGDSSTGDGGRQSFGDEEDAGSTDMTHQPIRTLGRGLLDDYA